ncbi:hypothetical protein L1887_21560 [Cichorium endivia]|nr:hypothetical protein L1887_21560 [Cichorium endivia]
MICLSRLKPAICRSRFIADWKDAYVPDLLCFEWKSVAWYPTPRPECVGRWVKVMGYLVDSSSVGLEGQDGLCCVLSASGTDWMDLCNYFIRNNTAISLGLIVLAFWILVHKCHKEKPKEDLVRGLNIGAH